MTTVNRPETPVAELQGGDTILALIGAQVRARPAALALSGVDGDYSYLELADTIDFCAQSLRTNGIRPGEVVAVPAAPSIAAVCALLGVLHAGGVVLPLDPSQPPRRQQQLTREAGADRTIHPEQLLRAGTVPARSGVPRVIGGGAAYIIFTSGSTGTPKGVVCRHDALVNVAREQRRVFHLTPADRVAQIAPWSVDAALFEITLALAGGATLHIATPPDRYPGPPLERFLQHTAATVLVATPSTLRALRPPVLPRLRMIISAGEELSPDLARMWVPRRRVINAYGVTEATIWSSYTELTAGQLSDAQFVPLGEAIGGCQLTLRDAAGRPAEPGEPGEIWLQGVGIAAGYLGSSGKHHERFTTEPGGRTYRTGDLAVRDESGALRFLGRGDDQVKLGGLRVDLGEVQQVLTQHPDVQECAVRRDQNRLAAYVVPRAGATVASRPLTEWMEERLPVQLVPSLYISITALPLTAWGKLDVAALPSPAAAAAAAQRAAPPNSPAEAALITMVSEILLLPNVFPSDDLFMLGLTSLTLARLMATVLTVLGTQIDPVDVFENPTIAGIAALIDERGRDAT